LPSQCQAVEMHLVVYRATGTCAGSGRVGRELHEQLTSDGELEGFPSQCQAVEMHLVVYRATGMCAVTLRNSAGIGAMPVLLPLYQVPFGCAILGHVPQRTGPTSGPHPRPHSRSNSSTDARRVMTPTQLRGDAIKHTCCAPIDTAVTFWFPGRQYTYCSFSGIASGASCAGPLPHRTARAARR